MSSDRDAQLLMRQLSHPPFTNIVAFCGNDEDPGRDELPEWQIWTNRETTRDQLRIEEQLERLILPSSSILHIGVGNSSLARRFAARVGTIVGTTLHPEEQVYADGFHIPNYHVMAINKFANAMDRIDQQFDFIVDNNPSAFACCLFHFCRMMIFYKDLLCDAGMILTAEPGLSWVCTSNNPEWFLTWRDWAQLGAVLRMPTRQLTEFVYIMERTPESGAVAPGSPLSRG
jgi:hypothetical protein